MEQYSASEDDLETVAYILDFQLMERRVSGQAPQSESEYAWRVSCGEAESRIP